MNDHLSTDQRQLELATLRKISDSVVLDAATIAQRKAWLAAGAAAEAAGREGLDQNALLASLQSELIPAAKPVRELAESTFDWSWGAVGMAAVLLIGATVIGSLSYRWPERMPPERKLQLVERDRTAPREMRRAGEPRTLRSETPSSNLPGSAVAADAGESSWDDLDSRIESTYTAIQALETKPRGVDATLTEFENQIRQLSEEVAAESL
jgi:hypothetical protein